MLRLLFLFFLALNTASLASGFLRAATLNAVPIDQRSINKRGCGPIALMNAYRFSSNRWQPIVSRIPGDTAGKQFVFLVTKYGNKYSRHTQGRTVWDFRTGMHALDLSDLANDFHRDARLPLLNHQSLFLKDKETHAQLVTRLHKTMRSSFKNGFPPLLNIRRFAKQTGNDGPFWRSITGHFVMVYEIPDKLTDPAKGIPIRYIDPWGGKLLSGSILIPTENFFAHENNLNTRSKMRPAPCLNAAFPQTKVGLDLIKPHEKSSLILDGMIGCF